MPRRLDLSQQPWADVPRALFITTDLPDACTTWRVWWPANELHARGHVADYVKYGDLNLAKPQLDYGRYTHIVTPRMSFPSLEAEESWLRLVDDFQSRGMYWLYDADDDLFSPAFVERTLNLPQPGLKPLVEAQRLSRLRLLELCDGVTVASQALAVRLADHTRSPVVVVPNGIFPASFQRAVHARDRAIPPLTVGWSGGPRLEADLAPMFEVWPRIAEEFPDVQFVIQGWLPPTLLQCMPLERLCVIDGQPIADYPAELQNIDVFCLFAADDPWIWAKTPIKWWEATLAGAACVASSTLYGPSAHPPHDVLQATTADEWHDALVELLSSQELRRDVHEAACKTVLDEHTMQHTAEDWLLAWHTIGRH